MTLRERLLALADEGDAKAWALNRHALALAAARMALDDAAKNCQYNRCLDCADAIRALRSQLDQSEGRG